MPIRLQRVLTFATFAAAMITAPAFAQRDFDRVEIQRTQLAPGVYMIEGAGGNIGVSAGEDGVVLIDDQFAPLHDKIGRASCRERV